ncbi:MAG: redoxin domain-containing protein [Synechococcales cyanobacterium C42_A2020_086]|jgi:peroxiredoxin/predicted 2-oxoglutarate/Fe(II)-dependent dioxygenase YbiX|nr:redoxin domain-containing protein [Synechococcales cyanobacterium M58_A2018_015]MBF2076648.1 redoxin domain-containing protein [Synechococcales cyanobacterium C42_A2020_086]
MNTPVLTVGDHAPWFTLPTSSHGASQDVVMGGYRAVLFFFGSSSNPQVQKVLAGFMAARERFEHTGIRFFGISIDPNDRFLEQQASPSSHFQFLWDFSGDLSIRYGLCQLGKDGTGRITYDPTTFVLDENLRILNLFPLETNVNHVHQVMSFIQALPPPPRPRLITQQAPVLLIPQVFQSDVCQQLIDRYEAEGGIESGFMRQEGDKTVVVVDPAIKRRRDWLITDPALISQINGLISRRVVPEIEKAFQFRVTSFERYVVACYEAANQGFFRPHRDNKSAGTAHRRFALTLNLNTGAYEGGCLRFPEYGPDLYSASAGSAIVFSCSLLHEATPITQGRRFVLLSFLYGDEDAKLRQQTQQQIVRRDGSTVAPAGNTPIQAPQPRAELGFQPRTHLKGAKRR